MSKATAVYSNSYLTVYTTGRKLRVQIKLRGRHRA